MIVRASVEKGVCGVTAKYLPSTDFIIRIDTSYFLSFSSFISLSQNKSILITSQGFARQQHLLLLRNKTSFFSSHTLRPATAMTSGWSKNPKLQDLFPPSPSPTALSGKHSSTVAAARFITKCPKQLYENIQTELDLTRALYLAQVLGSAVKSSEIQRILP